MRKISALALLALGLFLSACATLPKSNGTGFGGHWKGRYFYPPPAMSSVEFEMDFVQTGQEITGTVVEPATFGSGSSEVLRATLKGTVSDTGAVKWVKSYDGTNNVSHSVSYSAQWTGKVLDGFWDIGGGKGNFFAEKR